MVKDIGWKEYFLDNDRFADIVNGIGCNGEQVVVKEDLQEADTQSGTTNRDCIRKVAFGINFAIVGVENQESIDYSMPTRSMEYDTQAYKKQVSQIKRENEKRPETLTKEEFLYKFKKDDKLHPVVTFVLYADSHPWDGATSLHEMLDFENIPESLRDKVSDYKMNLVNIRTLTNTDVFRTDVKQVFDFIRCADDKEALKSLISSDPHYENMAEDACYVALQYSKAEQLKKGKELSKKAEGGVDMCKAITDWMEESEAKGKAEGKAEGKALTKRVFKGFLAGKDNDEIAQICGISEAEVAEILA